jgi:hypothetical protein
MNEYQAALLIGVIVGGETMIVGMLVIIAVQLKHVVDALTVLAYRRQP